MSASDSQPFVLRGEYITLDALLKAANVCSSGGAAKLMISEGEVRVDGEVETRRGRKLRPGQRVRVGELQLRIDADPDGPSGHAAA
jgi:ribosome-associated protein